MLLSLLKNFEKLHELPADLGEQTDWEGKSSPTFRNVQFALDIATATNLAQLQQVKNALHQVKEGITPSYRRALLLWEQQRRKNLLFGT